jgi:predicted dehydrogenase
MLAGRPQSRQTARLDPILTDPRVDAVAIATPAATHFELVQRALAAGKHVLVEKPFTTRSSDAVALIALAERLQRVLFVGHVFEYSSAILAAKELIRAGELGDIRYIRCERTNLGPVRTDVNALWDLAAHDLSILHLLMDRSPDRVTATGEAHLRRGIEDVASATFFFSKGPKAHIHVSWLNPVKVRRMTVMGSRAKLLWDDLDYSAPLRLFDCDGGVHTPPVERNMPLRAELVRFLKCLKSPRQAYSDGRSGLRVVQALEAASASMRFGGAEVAVPTHPAPDLAADMIAD